MAYLGTTLVLIAPLLVTLVLKVNSLVGIEQAPNSLALVTGSGALLAMVGNPFFGKTQRTIAEAFFAFLRLRNPFLATSRHIQLTDDCYRAAGFAPRPQSVLRRRLLGVGKP